VLNVHGQIAEAAVANIFCVRDGALLTPPRDRRSARRNHAPHRARARARARHPAHERTLGRFDLLACAEAFLTGSGAGLVPVRSLDGERIGGPGPVFTRIRAAFERAAPALGVPFQ
jgi:branched-chain amino acid aminotransferase